MNGEPPLGYKTRGDNKHQKEVGGKSKTKKHEILRHEIEGIYIGRALLFY